MEPVALIDRLNAWIRESVTVKLISIGILVILLLIPTAWILQIMEERQQRAEAVMEEVYAKWSGSQTVAGPVLVIPYRQPVKSSAQPDAASREVIDYAFFLPSDLQVAGQLKPQVLHRGIFDVAVYESTLRLTAAFDAPDMSALGIVAENVLWNEARVVAGISDLRGIAEPPVLKVGDTPLSVEPSNEIGFNFFSSGASSTADRVTGSTGVQASWKGAAASDFQGTVQLELALKGSNVMRFLPLGKTTALTLGGAWPDPSFEGEFLPITRRISKDDFEATWKVLHFNRPFRQQWVSKDQTLEAYDMSTRLVIPADQYQKSIRTAKYGILLILLSFTALFLVEISRKIRIHPFQYILIGVALIVYYTLLLSLSEYIGYNFAYVAATLATVILVSLYAKSFLKEMRLSVLFACLLTLFYGFVFVIVQAQDFSLLIGSVGLFTVVAAIMYFSRSINWYGTEAG